MRPAVFFDRDGVLNHSIIRNGKPYSPTNLSECVIPHDAKSALSMLKKAGFWLIGCTNQPDVARGTTTRAVVQELNNYLMRQLPLDGMQVCYHDDADACYCRKPLPGLLYDASKLFALDLPSSFMVGDRWKDMDAGKAAGCKTIWLRVDYAEKQPKKPDFIGTSLTEIAQWILEYKLHLTEEKTRETTI